MQRSRVMGLYQNRIVVKIGTSTLMNEVGKSDLRSMEHLIRVLADIHNMGYELILVSSGAIAAGVNKLKLKTRPNSLRMKQAVSAVGQCSLLYLYDRFFGDYDKTIAQILLNAEDMEQEEKKDNLTNTFDSLLELGVIPIVNENDSVNYSEIEAADHSFGDNDFLSAVVATLCKAKRLVILADINGIYDKDPRKFPDARPIERIEQFDETVYSYTATRGSRRGAAGVKTKLHAAETATANGTDVVIMNGKNPEALYEILKGGSAGTLFPAMRADALRHEAPQHHR